MADNLQIMQHPLGLSKQPCLRADVEEIFVRLVNLGIVW